MSGDFYAGGTFVAVERSGRKKKTGGGLNGTMRFSGLALQAEEQDIPS